MMPLHFRSTIPALDMDGQKCTILARGRVGFMSGAIVTHAPASSFFFFFLFSRCCLVFPASCT